MNTSRITVLTPAHDEASTISATIQSLWNQTWPVDRIIVVCDNCTDDTEQIARSLGTDIYVTENNSDKKSGALNQALGVLLPQLDDDEFVLVMDADSTLNPEWVQSAMEILLADKSVGSACGIFVGEPGNGLVGQFQRNEYRRYQRSCHRRRQAFVLSGTGSIFRVFVMREVAANRGTRLPGINGEFYNRLSITEDNCITLAIKTLGYKCLAPVGAQTTTEVMPTWKQLIRQRLRWQSGALTDLRAFGFSRVTAPYIARQLALYVGFACMWICLSVMLGALVRHGSFSVFWGAGVLAVNAIERTWTAKRAGWKGMLLGLLVFPEVGYSIFLSIVFFAALKKVIARQDMEWNHLTREKEEVSA